MTLSIAESHRSKMQKLSLNVNISQLKSDMMPFHPSIHPLLRPLIICKVLESIQANTVRVAGYASLVPRITKYQNGSLALAVGGSFLGITLKVTRCSKSNCFFLWHPCQREPARQGPLNWNHGRRRRRFISPLAHPAQLCHSFHVMVN